MEGMEREFIEALAAPAWDEFSCPDETRAIGEDLAKMLQVFTFVSLFRGNATGYFMDVTARDQNYVEFYYDEGLYDLPSLYVKAHKKYGHIYAMVTIAKRVPVKRAISQ